MDFFASTSPDTLLASVSNSTTLTLTNLLVVIGFVAGIALAIKFAPVLIGWFKQAVPSRGK